MKPQQRRVFLKVIAVGPLLGCSGVDDSAPHGAAAGAGSAGGGGGAGGASNPTQAGAGNPSLAGAPSAGAPSSSPGGTSAGGSPAFAGNNAGGASSAGSGQAGALAAGAGAPSAGGGSSNNPAGDIGNVSAYPLGSFSIAGNIYFMGHDAGGLYAMSMQCTHAGCACTMAGDELDCPCHGSRFDHQGKVLKGPATVPLPHYKVSVDGAGNISVDRFTTVSSATRTPV